MPGIIPGMPGIGIVWPSAAYELVMESITDCAFSCPISKTRRRDKLALYARWIKREGGAR